MVQRAQENENPLYGEKYKQEEVYAYFKSYYTKDHIDKVILGGYMKLTEGYWGMANIGSEYIEGAYL